MILNLTMRYTRFFKNILRPTATLSTYFFNDPRKNKIVLVLIVNKNIHKKIIFHFSFFHITTKSTKHRIYVFTNIYGVLEHFTFFGTFVFLNTVGTDKKTRTACLNYSVRKENNWKVPSKVDAFEKI